MILVADAGNTHIKLGIYDQERLIAKARLLTKMPKLPEEFEQDIASILRDNEINAGDIEAIAVATVASAITTQAFLEGLSKLFAVEPLVVNTEMRTGIEIRTDVPAELGIDRLVNAAAAFHEYGGGGPLLVVDFGTATTYDVITQKGEFLGGVIAPGIRSCAEALWEKTAKLPIVEIEKPDRVMGTNTVDSMKSGIFYGYLGQFEYLVRHLKEELETRTETETKTEMETGTDFKVIATGGLAGIFRGNTNAIDIFDSELTLKGLSYISKIHQLPR
ncbi:MAG TPA: type III pantothenate kinase [Firmicutes bacterium]|jgi:type III pantothenate kinase|nr:type III pantothenate kinase [Bacillota bacterium]HAZ21518.1 type III pantothenate kinase [Bacillota bacterium]HBE05636.1 type III pantothenate kinase [Bacillota bacterium]HBR24476.1 type III pantothenate kinase [Bacillota bacterium]HCM17992.1 type III pantothenate kinase [Bacillota bacterium]